MKFNRLQAWRGIALSTLALCAGSAAWADELMTDRCSAEVAIVGYGSKPNSPGAVVLKRHSNGSTGWTPPFTVALSGDGHIRWWCRSTTGNAFDAGTWRIRELAFGTGTRCETHDDGSPENCVSDVKISIASSEWQGWTPERSRCSNHSRKIRARLGPNRLLQIQCMGK